MEIPEYSEMNYYVKGTECSDHQTLSLPVLLVQGVATSIDAFLIGITISVRLNFSIFIAAAIIGAVTFLLVFIALFIGKSLGKMLGKCAEWAGAAILFLLAIKELVFALL